MNFRKPSQQVRATPNSIGMTTANFAQQEMVQVGPYPSLERTNSTTS